MENFKTYHIIGAGISGLSEAKKLKQKNPSSKVIIYEATNHLGGRCHSYYNKKLECNLDNATHVVLGANSKACQLLGKVKFHKKTAFYNLQNNKISHKFWNFIPHILISIFNTLPQQLEKWQLFKLAFKLFPFSTNKRKIYFSQNNLSKKLIEPLSRYADEIKKNYTLKKFEIQKDKISKLIFNKEIIEIAQDDEIISALDAHNYHKIFQGPKFEFSTIINVFFKTSQKLYLPNNVEFLAVINGLSHWIFVNNNIVAVTISAAENLKLSNEELAMKLWQELAKIRNVNVAFLPPYQVVRHKRATIKQDAKNNALRPNSSKTKFSNLRVVGDFVKKDTPCSIESVL